MASAFQQLHQCMASISFQSSTARPLVYQRPITDTQMLVNGWPSRRPKTPRPRARDAPRDADGGHHSFANALTVLIRTERRILPQLFSGQCSPIMHCILAARPSSNVLACLIAQIQLRFGGRSRLLRLLTSIVSVSSGWHQARFLLTRAEEGGTGASMGGSNGVQMGRSET